MKDLAVQTIINDLPAAKAQLSAGVPPWPRGDNPAEGFLIAFSLGRAFLVLALLVWGPTAFVSLIVVWTDQ